MKQRVLLLGSTGSIGQSALNVLSKLNDRFEVVGLSACTRWRDLAAQAERFGVKNIALTNEDFHEDLKGSCNIKTDIFIGPDSLVELVNAVECDCVITAVVGAAGLPATLRAVELGHRLAIANKEPLVMAGGLLCPLAEKTGAEILPVDSEHSAIFQSLHSGKRSDVQRIFLTASGGPFRKWTIEQINNASLEDALNHPTWDMGPKITIDSATMMNKALEIVEARWLFNMSHDCIDVLIHPESIVHSAVEFVDGSVIAQLGTPDMKTPIQYALTYPDRLPCPAAPLDLLTMGKLTFDPPDPDRFPALRLGHETAARGGTAGAVLNAANEAAVDAFRTGRIAFREIVALTEDVLNRHAFSPDPSLDDLVAIDAWARNEVSQCLV